ncbi:hypothetical protein DBR40_19915 [Pedobacter sp. KBW01]|uniref:hypothetical protein n=1 Tax=Pedobacter sp. KBW01 TaxID=2153364 RepID=UPI000F5AE9C3|nr:hypothetical protein [Pedobacter sp. KBW01]RQO68510.1 hypothetical protein DBR40_19915 [Pedobacter sp. KBW01]
MRLAFEEERYLTSEMDGGASGGGYEYTEGSAPAETPAPVNNTNYMMLAVVEPAITAQPYTVEAFNVPNDELGIEAMPAGLIETPITSKKWWIIGAIIVLGLIGYSIYKQTKNNNKKY